MPDDQTLVPILSDVLRAIPFFRNLPDEDPECLELLRCGSVDHYRDGDVIQRRGEIPDMVFLIEGNIRIEGATAPTGPYPGHYGAVDILDRQRASASLIACGDATIFRLPGADLGRLLDTCERLARQLLEDFANYLNNPPQIGDPR